MSANSLLGAFLLVGLFGVLTWLLLCLVALLIVAGINKKGGRFVLWSIAGTTGAMLAAVALFYGVFEHFLGPYDPTSQAELQSAYRADFGILPPTGITVLKARQIIVGDSGRQWLKLKATPEQIQQHIAMGFTSPEATPYDFTGKTVGNAPRWWKPPTERLEIYENKNWSKDGGWLRSEAAIGIDRTSQLIWFVASKSS